MNSDMPSIVSKRPEKQKSDHRAVDALYRISAFASSQPDPKLALEGILDEVMNVFDAAQPALLYIVPGVLGATFIRAALAREIGVVWNHCEGLEEAQAERDAADSKKKSS